MSTDVLMIPYDKLTIVRNRYRARELRRFRELVESYFERAYVADDMPVDWSGVRAARAEINQMLPRVLQLVRAAGLEAHTAETSDPGPSVADVFVLRKIFVARYADGRDQEILDVIDMALGVYQASRFDAMLRTINPFHYAVRVLVFVAQIPKRSLKAVGLWPRPSVPRLRSDDVARLEAAAARFADADDVIERRFAEMGDRLAERFAGKADELGELAERLDFLERVLAQERSIGQLKPPAKKDVATPV